MCRKFPNLLVQTRMSDPALELEKINQHLLQQLECPICTNYLLPPIEQCKNGHNICQICRVKVNRCPSCQALFSGIRNRFAESIADTLPYPCENRYAGCSVTLLNKYLLPHQQSCRYRMHHCLAGKGSGCTWVGQRSQLAKHVKKEHPNLCIKGEKRSLELHVPEITATCVNYRLILAHGELFWLREKQDRNTQQLRWCVRYIGSEVNAKNYKYQIKFTTPDENHEMISTHITNCDYEDMTESSKCVNLTYHVINLYKGRDDILKFNVTVLKCKSSSFWLMFGMTIIFSISLLSLFFSFDLHSYDWSDVDIYEVSKASLGI